MDAAMVIIMLFLVTTPANDGRTLLPDEDNIGCVGGMVVLKFPLPGIPHKFVTLTDDDTFSVLCNIEASEIPPCSSEGKGYPCPSAETFVCMATGTLHYVSMETHHNQSLRLESEFNPVTRDLIVEDCLFTSTTTIASEAITITELTQPPGNSTYTPTKTQGGLLASLGVIVVIILLVIAGRYMRKRCKQDKMENTDEFEM